MESKGKRLTFNKRHWEALQDIVIHAEGGRFMRALVVRDNSRNLDKAEIWDNITSHFNQVSFWFQLNILWMLGVSDCECSCCTEYGVSAHPLSKLPFILSFRF
jgi:hypothetical protein